MLELKNVSISTILDREIIKNVSLVLNPGDKLCIIGEEGNGKSTLMKWIYDTRLVDSYVKVTGSIQKNGKKLGYLEQFLDPAWKETDIISYCLKEKPEEAVPYENYDQIQEIYPLLDSFKIPKSYLQQEKKMGTLSGGEKVKIQLIKIMLGHPDILLLDEPTNDLDIRGLEWLENVIKNTTIPLLYISHDEVLLERTANAVLHLESIQNKTQARTTYERIGYLDYIKKRNYLISRQNQIAKNEKKAYEKQKEQYRQIFQKVQHAQNTISRQDPFTAQLLKKKMKTVKALEKRLDQTEVTNPVETEESVIAKFHTEDKIHPHQTILSYQKERLSCGDTILSKDILLRVIGQEKVCIIGENGCGKTTLLQDIYEVLQQNSKLNVGYMPQHYEDFLEEESTPIAFLQHTYTKEELTRIRTYLGSMKFTTEEMEGKIAKLSGGQKAKLFLLKLILGKCDVCVLDEPTRNLSPLTNPVIRTMLKEFKGAIISVSHDRKYIEEVCSSIYCLDATGLHMIK